jgi:hypothetical protein
MEPDWYRPFLLNLERTGNVSRSAGLAGVSSTAAYGRRKADADFAAAWDQALEDHTDRCEEELTRRAFGYEEPVVYQGQLTPVWERDENGDVLMAEQQVPTKDGWARGTAPVQARNEDGSLRWLTVTKFSDTLLLARVKAYRKRYSTDRTELTGADGGPVATTSTERAARVAHLLDVAQRRREAAGDTNLEDYA